MAKHWDNIRYQLGLKDKDMDSIEEDASKTDDRRLAGKKVMKTWIGFTNGKEIKEPKIWTSWVCQW